MSNSSDFIGDAGVPNHAGALVTRVTPVLQQTPCAVVYDRLLSHSQETTLAVIDPDQRPIGIISRFTWLSRYAQRFVPELYGRKPISDLMETEPLIVDEAT